VTPERLRSRPSPERVDDLKDALHGLMELE